MPQRSTQRFCTRNCGKAAWERNHPGRQNSGAAKRLAYGYEKRPIIGLDGEGLDDPPRYIMLLASNGDGIVDLKGLPTDACLEFLVSLPSQSLKWGFAFSYDVNMILGSWPRPVLAALWRSIVEPDGSCSVTYRRWRVRWVPGRQFVVKDLRTGRSCCVWDVWPFEQRSFAEWLEAGRIAPSEAIARIRVMKERRDAFDKATTEEIATYCWDEVTYLERGVRQMIALFKAAGLVPASYYGAGSLAGAMLRKHGVLDHLAPAPTEYESLIRQAFRGGRFENAFIGWEPEGVALDLNSAYAAGALTLPCLRCVVWRYVDRPPRTAGALVHVVWDLGDPETVRWGPFPVRVGRGPLSYPVAGEGWYWVDEVRAAQRVWGKRIRVLEALEIVRRCRHEPFAFVASVYDERQLLQASGDPREKVLKTALSATYGKLAQQVGDPTFQSFVWAGIVTSRCRAAILDAMVGYPDNVRMIATDGILACEVPGQLTLGDGLGEWKARRVQDVLAIQPGLYYYRTPDGEEHVRSRGFGRADLSFEQAAALIRREVKPSVWAVLRGTIRVRTRRFRGLGSVVRTGAWAGWRRWLTDSRKIKLNPWPRRGFLRCFQGRVETFAIPVAQGEPGTEPPDKRTQRWEAEREAERDPGDGGSMW